MGGKNVSMKWKMVGIVLICWLLPFALMVGVLVFYVWSNQSDTAAQNILDQLTFNNQICMERLDYAVTASRNATYDRVIEEAHRAYQEGKAEYHTYYTEISSYIARKYRNEICFSDTMIWSGEDAAAKSYSVYNSSAGGRYQQVLKYWNEDHARVAAYAKTLDTAIGFMKIGDHVYMVRNLLDINYKTIGTLVMRLNLDYCFGPLYNFPLGEAAAVFLAGEKLELKGTLENDAAALLPELSLEEGYLREDGKLYVYDSQTGQNFKLSVLMRVDKKMMQEPFYGYRYVFAGMILFLFPLLLLIWKVFQDHVAKPVEVLMDGASQIEQGKLGVQIETSMKNREFQYLMDSFNRMSERLKYQFDHIYEEEVALRDARIMALQSNINPHFMNNTLEIINWEARLGNNAKVSKMIEALSTLMDAAMDRRKRPEVLLSEEMMYVDAYLYIISERFGKRLTVQKNLPSDIMEYSVPRLILQPVIENAIEHGVVPNGTGLVEINGSVEGDYLYLDIVNNGVLDESAREKIGKLLSSGYDPSREPSANLGIANVNQRLHILYGEPCGLRISQRDPGHVLARLTICVVQKEQDQARNHSFGYSFLSEKEG